MTVPAISATITDGDGNVTTIERDGSGNPSAIVAPFGQRTTLAVNGDGYLSRVTNPAGEAVQLTYNSGDAEGLLATLTDPRGNVHRYLYDALGRLIRDENPAGGVKTLARTDITDDHYTVTLTTALGLVTTYEVEELPTGDTRRVRIDPSGARTESLIRTDGSRRVTYPDGTVTNSVEGPDPRFGMQAPILKSRDTDHGRRADSGHHTHPVCHPRRPERPPEPELVHQHPDHRRPHDHHRLRRSDTHADASQPGQPNRHRYPRCRRPSDARQDGRARSDRPRL